MQRFPEMGYPQSISSKIKPFDSIGLEVLNQLFQIWPMVTIWNPLDMAALLIDGSWNNPQAKQSNLTWCFGTSVAVCKFRDEFPLVSLAHYHSSLWTWTYFRVSCSHLDAFSWGWKRRFRKKTHMWLSENVVYPLNPMVNDHYPY